MSVSAWETAGLAIGAAVGIITLLGACSAALVKTGRSALRIGRFLDQWLGHGEGSERAPGVIERLDVQDRELSRIRAQVLPNGGSSLRDAVDDVRRRLDEHLSDAATAQQQFQDHMRGHDGSH